MSGLGLNASLTQRAIDELPAEISLAFAPYAKDLEFWTAKARQAGHEILVELPMEAHGSRPDLLGNAALLTSQTADENRQRLHWLMSRFKGYFAVTNYLGGKFSSDAHALAPILAEFQQTGIGYIDDTGAASTIAKKTGVKFAYSKVIRPAKDHEGRQEIRRNLTMLEEASKNQGYVLGKTYLNDATLDELLNWTNSLSERQLSLAPASALLQ